LALLIQPMTPIPVRASSRAMIEITAINSTSEKARTVLDRMVFSRS